MNDMFIQITEVSCLLILGKKVKEVYKKKEKDKKQEESSSSCLLDQDAVAGTTERRRYCRANNKVLLQAENIHLTVSQLKPS